MRTPDPERSLRAFGFCPILARGHWSTGQSQPSLVHPSEGGGSEMIRGSCLCGGVRFEIDRAVGPFELCHCPRCRKASGSAFMAGLGVRVEEIRWLSGTELIRTFEAPIRERAPAYCAAFCSQCGSPVPNPPAHATCFEIPAGLLDDDPALRPDKHIFVECKSPWFLIADALPQLTKAQLLQLRVSLREG